MFARPQTQGMHRAQHCSHDDDATMSSLALLQLGGLACAERLTSLAVATGSDVGPLDPRLLFLGSFAALATLIFAAPNVPFARPRNTFGGHLICVSLAMALHWTVISIAKQVEGGQFEGQDSFAMSEKFLTPALGIACMLRLRLLHPPAAACGAISPFLPDAQLQGPQFLLLVLMGCTWMILVEVRCVPAHSAPSPIPGTTP